jgi:hypothetical protein
MFLKKIISQLPRHHQEYNLLIQKIVNPSNQPWTSVYCGAGCDLINFLTTTNSTRGYFLDRYSDLYPYVENYGDQNYEINEDYLKYKFQIGYGSLGFLERPYQQMVALVSELFVLQVEERSIRVEKCSLGFVLKFNWRHALDIQEKKREIYFINQNLEDVSSLVRLINKLEDLDCLYQKAPLGLPLLYKEKNNYINVLDKKLKPKGIFLTDDFAFLESPSGFSVRNFSAYFPLKLKLEKQQILDLKKEAITRIPRSIL